MAGRPQRRARMRANGGGYAPGPASIAWQLLDRDGDMIIRPENKYLVWCIDTVGGGGSDIWAWKQALVPWRNLAAWIEHPPPPVATALPLCVCDEFGPFRDHDTIARKQEQACIWLCAAMSGQGLRTPGEMAMALLCQLPLLLLEQPSLIVGSVHGYCTTLPWVPLLECCAERP